MPRFFVEPQAINGDEIIIEGTDVNHIKNVLRMKCGDTLVVCDRAGTDYCCTVKSMNTDAVYLEISSFKPCAAELEQRFYLFQGLPKSDKMESIIQKAVELGVYEIIPVVNARCIAKIEPKKEEKKISRWQQISEAAAKQSGRGIIPRIMPPMPYAKALEYALTLEGALIPYEKAQGISHTREIINEIKNKNSIGIFIGPEGGFEEKEIELACQSNVLPITLGKRILRTETAGPAILAALMISCEKD